MKIIRNIFSTFVIALLFPWETVAAQNFSVKADIDSSFLLIGEQACLSFDVNQLKDEKIQLPLFSDTIITGIELIERLKPDTTILPGERILVKHSFVITSFDTALYYIPPFPIFNDKGDTVESNPMALTVFTVDIDTVQYEIADIKPVYVPPFDWKNLFLIIMWVVLGVAFLFGIYWLIRRFVQKKPIFSEEKPKPERPAHIVALEALDKIKEEKRWEKESAKLYYTEVTDVIRIYIDKRFELNAMESTSEEIIAMLSKLNPSAKALTTLKDVLQLADLVKFAKWQPIYDDYLKSLADAYLFVNETKIEETEENTGEQENLKEEE